MAKIVIVEDDSLTQNIFQTKFSSLGSKVLVLPNAEGDFVDRVKSFGPDMVLMDVELCPPNGGFRNGFEAVELLRQDEATKKLPVIFLSNLSGNEERQKAEKLGAIEYLIKAENTPAEIVEKVFKILGK